MRKTNTQKGITLIALIITIVVLLILAAVAINAVTGEGIIQYATKAKTDYEKAQAEEQGVLSYYQTYLEAEGQVGKWVQEEATRKVSRKEINSDGEEIITEFEVNVPSDLIRKVNKDGTVDEILIGEYVNYVSNTNTNMKWRVLGVEDGQILLMSASDVATLTLNGGDIYYTGISQLNEICEKYADGEGAYEARTITANDVNKLTGYNPEVLGNSNTDINEYGNEITYKLKNGNIEYTSTNGNGGTFTGTEFWYLDNNNEWQPELIEDTKTFKVDIQEYDASLSSNYVAVNMKMPIQSGAYKILFLESDETNYSKYWLGSRVLKQATTGKGILYGLLQVNLDGVGYYCASNSSQNQRESGVRAIVKLKSDVNLEKINEVWEIDS